MKKKPYNELPLVPALIADAIVNEVFTLTHLRYSAEVIENKRKELTSQEREEFIQYADKRCQIAYEAGVDWFKKCLRNNKGRDFLYEAMRHWLAAYCMHREQLLKEQETFCSQN